MGHEGHDHDANGHGHDHDADGHGHDHDPPPTGEAPRGVDAGATIAGDGPLAAPTPRGDLAPGAGRGKILFLDAPSGLAGDMVVAALVDLGVPRRVIEGAVDALGLRGFHLHFGTRSRSGIVAAAFDVHVDANPPPRTYGTIRALLERAPLSGGTRERALRTFDRLAAAEAKVHRRPVEEVHFHEVGAVDSIVDVVGAAAALDHLGARLIVSPLPIGRGFVRAAHGRLPLPAPATVECLAGLATYDAGIDFELVTPTGAAIAGALSDGCERWPAMVPERVGWGAGSADLADRPNLLRAILGAPTVDSAADRVTHAVLEANVDDATGELAASWIAALLEAGAIDAWATPIVMKKGRPALTITALAPVEREASVTHAMLRETTSLGVRRFGVSRTIRPRRTQIVVTPYGRIPVKVSEGPFGPPQAKPEFDACARAAAAYGVPVREVLRAAVVASADPASPSADETDAESDPSDSG